MNVSTDFENLIKLLILGDSAVGKTNFLFRFNENKFTESHISTIGFDFKSQIVTLPNSKKVVKLQIWDTAGQERYMAVNKNLFLRVQGIILMYDITKRQTFEHITKWMKNIRDICDNIPIIIVGNKCDLDEERIVTTEEGKKLSDSFGVDFIEASGKDGKNVKEAFFSLSEKILSSVKRGRIPTISLNKGQEIEKKKEVKGCC